MSNKRTPTSRRRLSQWVHEFPSFQYTDTAEQADDNTTIQELRRMIQEPLPNVGVSTSTAMPTAPVNPGQGVFQESQDPDDSADEVIPDAPPANVRGTCPAPRPRKKKLTSPVWQDFDHYEQHVRDGIWQRWGICKLCKTRFNASSTQGTNHLRNHAQRCKAKHAATGTTHGGTAVAVGTLTAQVNSFDPNVGREALAQLIYDADLPIGFGEHSAFQKYMKTFFPQFQSVSRNTTRSDIVQLYNRRKAGLIEEFHKGSFCFALTSDVWTGRSREDYISAVAHYVDDEWNLQKRIIGFRLLDVAHTGTNIWERILNVLIDSDLKIELLLSLWILRLQII